MHEISQAHVKVSIGHVWVPLRRLCRWGQEGKKMVQSHLNMWGRGSFKKGWPSHLLPNWESIHLWSKVESEVERECGHWPAREKEPQECAFWKWGLLACIICFGFMFDFYFLHLMCMNHALPFHSIVWPSTAWVPHILAFPSTLHIHLWIYMFDIPCIETRIILAFAFYIFL